MDSAYGPPTLAWNNRDYSPLSDRSISSRSASRGDLPSFDTAYIWRVIGSSTARRAGEVHGGVGGLTPSATMRMPPRISSSVRPRPSSKPTVRLRLSVAVAGEDEIAQSGESGERAGLASGGDGEAGDLG